MRGAERRPVRTRAAGLAFAAALLGLACAPGDGPVEPVWDATPCARCGMLVSEPRFAAQIHTPSGEVLHFDDPGCALLRAEERPADVRSLWFHEIEGERWLRGEETAFLSVEPTPMGYGLGAVAAGSAGALARGEALAQARGRDAARRVR